MFHAVLLLLAARTGQKIPKCNRIWSYNTESLFKLIFWEEAKITISSGCYQMIVSRSCCYFPICQRSVPYFYPEAEAFSGKVTSGSGKEQSSPSECLASLADCRLDPPPRGAVGRQPSPGTFWASAGLHLFYPSPLCQVSPLLSLGGSPANQPFLFSSDHHPDPERTQIASSRPFSWAPILLRIICQACIAQRIQRQRAPAPPCKICPPATRTAEGRFGLIMNSCLENKIGLAQNFLLS